MGEDTGGRMGDSEEAKAAKRRRKFVVVALVNVVRWLGSG